MTAKASFLLSGKPFDQSLCLPDGKSAADNGKGTGRVFSSAGGSSAGEPKPGRDQRTFASWTSFRHRGVSSQQPLFSLGHGAVLHMEASAPRQLRS